jgi:hypothetical protein
VLVSPGLVDKVVSCEHFYSTPPKWCGFPSVMTGAPSAHLILSFRSSYCMQLCHHSCFVPCRSDHAGVMLGMGLGFTAGHVRLVHA